VVYSTMTRATETHDIILKQLQGSHPSIVIPKSGSKSCDLIREGAVCRPEPDTWKGPTAQDYEEDNKRIEEAFRKYFHRSISLQAPQPSTDSEETCGTDNVCNQPSSTLFVCHGNVIRYFVMRALQLPPEAWLRTSVANASITIVSIHPSGRVSLQCMGETGHLNPELITFN
jgi:serine/threonine-protein phosphatase PGAM5